MFGFDCLVLWGSFSGFILFRVRFRSASVISGSFSVLCFAFIFGLPCLILGFRFRSILSCVLGSFSFLIGLFFNAVFGLHCFVFRVRFRSYFGFVFGLNYPDLGSFSVVIVCFWIPFRSYMLFWVRFRL